MPNGITYSPSDRVLAQPPESYKLSDPGKIKPEGKEREFLGTHNFKKDELYANHFQRVRATKDEFEGIADGYTAFFDIVPADENYKGDVKDYKGPYTAKLKPGSELDFHEVFQQDALKKLDEKPEDKTFIKKAKDFLKSPITTIFGDNSDKLKINKDLVSSEGVDKFQFTVTAGVSKSTGDHVEVEKRSAVDKSRPWKIAAGIGLAVVAVVAVAVVGPAAVIGALTSAFAGMSALGVVGGVVGGLALTAYVGKKLALLKSPWWGKTAEGQIQKLARDQSKELGEGFSKMVRSQMALDHTKSNIVGAAVEAEAPTLCDPKKLQHFLLLAKNKGPDELRKEIREFLLNPRTSFLDKSTIDRAKGGTGFFFAGGKKAHAEKTVNIVTDEIYKGIIRGVGEGYLDLLEAAVADQKTIAAQGVFKEAILPAVDEFKNAIEGFRQEELDSVVRGGESNTFEIYETEERTIKLEDYQRRASGFLKDIKAKSDVLGDSNVATYTEVLKGFDQDVKKHLDSLQTVKSLLTDPDHPSSLGTIQGKIGELLNNQDSAAEEIAQTKIDLLANLAEARRKINNFEETPNLLEVHHEALLKTLDQLESAINGAATIAETLSNTHKNLKENTPTRDAIDQHLENLNALEIPDVNPLRLENVYVNFARATETRDDLINDLASIKSLYEKQSNTETQTNNQIALAGGDKFLDGISSDAHKTLLAGFDEQKQQLNAWTGKGYASPSGLDPDKQKSDYLRNMAGAAAGIPQEARDDLSQSLEKLCNSANDIVLKNLKISGESKIEHLNVIENLLRDPAPENGLKNSCLALRSARSIYPEDSSKALALTQALFPDHTKNLAKYAKVSSTLDGLKKLFNGDIGTRLYGWAQTSDSLALKPESFESASFLSLIAKFQQSIEHDPSSTERLAISLNGVNDEVALLDQLDVLDSLLSEDLDEISSLQQNLEGQIADNERLVEFQAMSNAFEAFLNDGLERSPLADVIKKYTQVQPGMQEQAKEVGQHLKQTVGLIHDVKNSKILQNAQAEEAMTYLAKVFRTDPQTIQKAVQNNREIANTVNQFLYAYHATKVNEQSGLNGLSATTGFSSDELKNGIKTLASCPLSIVPDQKDVKNMSAKDYNSFKQRLEDRNNAISAALAANGDESEIKFLKSHRTVLEKFLYEEKAYKALLGGGELEYSHRIALEQISPNPKGRDSAPIVRDELLQVSRINSVQQQLQNNSKPELECSQKLLEKSPRSEFLASQVQHLQENTVGDALGIQDAYKNAHLGGAVSIGQRLVASERMKGLSSEEITASLQKEEFESLKKALKYINPKQMELQRPGLFMRLVNRILRRETGVEKLMSRVVDVPKAKEDLATLAKHGIATARLNEQLEFLELTQTKLQSQRDGLINDPEKAKVAINYLAAEHLAAKVVSDPDAKLSSDDISTIRSNWLNLAGNDDLWSDFSAILKEGTGFDDLMKSMSDEQRIAYQSSLTEIQEEKAQLRQRSELFRDELLSARSALFIPIKASDIASSASLLDNKATWVNKANQNTVELKNMNLGELLATMSSVVSKTDEKRKLLKLRLIEIASIYTALEPFYGEFSDQKSAVDSNKKYAEFLNARSEGLDQLKKDLQAKKNEISQINKWTAIGSASESVRDRLTTKNSSGSTPLDEIVALIDSRIDNLKNLCQTELKSLNEDNETILAQSDESETSDLKDAVDDLVSRFDLPADLKEQIIQKYESNLEGFFSLQARLVNVQTILEGQTLIRQAFED